MKDPERWTSEFPGYRLRETLRRSRVGTWILAEQLRIERNVLIKVAPSGDDRAARELEREARFLGEMSHPGLLTLIDFRPGGPLAHAIYEYPGSDTLEGLVLAEPGGWDLPRVARIARQLVEVIGALHARGVWLRQVLPCDLGVDRSGRLWLTSLEALEPEGIPARELAPLWQCPGAAGPAGDFFLLGLHVFFLITAKVPVPESIRHSPERWLDMVSRSLAARGSGPAGDHAGECRRRDRETGDAIRKLLSRLFTAGEDRSTIGVDGLLATLRRIEDGPPPPRPRPRRTGHPVRRTLLVVGALLLGTVLGAWGWRAMGPAPEETARAGGEIAARDSTGDAGPPVHPPAAGPGAGTSPGPEAVGDAPALPEEPAPDAAAAPGDPHPAGGEPEPADVPEEPRSSAPASDPEPAGGVSIPIVEPQSPGPLERFLSACAHAEAAPTSAEEWERLWEQGVLLLRALPVEDGSGAAGAAREMDHAKNVLGTLEEIGTRLESRNLWRSLFAVDIETTGSAHVTGRYDFSSARQEDDWIPYGDESDRRIVDRDRLAIRGRVVFRPGRFFRERVRLRWRVSADARDARRPNLNVLVWVPLAAGDEGSAVLDPVGASPFLFGVGTYFGNGIVGGRAGEAAAVFLPATVVLAGGAGNARSPLWASGERIWKKMSFARTEWFEFAWDPAGIAWRAGKLDVVSADELKKIVSLLEPLSGRSGSVGIEVFQSYLEVDEIIVEGTLDLERISARAREAARRRLEEELPHLLSGSTRLGED